MATTPKSIIKCRNCGANCAWVKSKKKKFYLTPINIDGKIHKVHGMNGNFYPMHQCAKKEKENDSI